MKVFVLALTVAFVASSKICLDCPDSQDSHVPGFKEGVIYRYQYEAVLMGGLPEEGLGRAGLRIRSKVVIAAIDSQKILLKLVKPEISEYSGIYPRDKFDAPTNLADALLGIETPVIFNYASGVVGELSADAAVSETIVNIYRGLISILQLNIKKTQNVYELREAGIHGVCKTHYALREDQAANRIYLTKSKDLSECQDKIIKDIGLSHFEKCVECEVSGKALKSAAAANYVMEPRAGGALIREAVVSEITEYTPFNILRGAAQMESRQNLTYVSETNTNEPTPRSAYTDRGTLQYQFGRELLQTPLHLLRNNSMEALIEVLEHLVNRNVQKVHEDAPLKFIEFIQRLRMSPRENIEALWRDYAKKPEYRHWILNAIPSMGTPTSLKFLDEKLMSLSTPEAGSALLMALHSVVPQQESIKLAEKIMMSSYIQERPVLRDLVMLAYGSVINKYYEKNSTDATVLRFILSFSATALTNKNYSEITLALKVLGNIGHPDSVKQILKHVPDFSVAAAELPLRIQVEAVLALRNIAKRDPKMIQEKVLQVFMEKSRDTELRIAAAVVLFETKLPIGLVSVMSASLQKERNLQVASFVYSYMKAMTKTTSPDYASVAVASNVAIRMLRPKLERLGIRYSRAFYKDAYYNPWMMGAAASAYYINDVTSILPKAIITKARAYLAGISVDALEFGVRAEGIQEALSKAKNIPADADRITKIKQVLSLLQDLKTHKSTRPLASMYLKVFGQEVAFANLEESIYKPVLEIANRPDIGSEVGKVLKALQAGYSMHYAKPTLAAEIRRILPTSAGLPMEISLYSAAVAAVSAGVKMEPEQPLDLMKLLDTDVTLKAEITPSVSMHTYVLMGVNAEFLQASLRTSAKAYAILPGKMEVSLEMSKGNFKIRLPPVQDVQKIAAARIETFALVRNAQHPTDAKSTPVVPVPVAPLSTAISKISKLVSSLAGGMSMSSEIITADLPRRISSKQKPLKPFTKKECVSSETFQIKVCTEIKSISAAYLRMTPLYAIIGSHVAEVTVEPTDEPAIERIEFEVQVGHRAAEKIIKVINQQEEEEPLEDKNVLLKLKKILVPGMSNNTVTSSRSRRSQSSSSSGTRSSSRSSKNSKSSRSSRSSRSSSSSSGSTSSKPSSSNSSHKSTTPRPNSQKPSSSSRSSSSRHSSRRSSSSSGSRSGSRSSSRSSSSCSSSSSVQSKVESKEFKKNHVHQHKRASNQNSRQSSASSFEEILKKAKYLSDVAKPSVIILLRILRVDHKTKGYQITAYPDKNRVQIIIANVAEDSMWRMCADAVKLSDHKLMAAVAWGFKCKQYSTSITAETGVVDQMPAARLKLAWKRIPRSMKRSARKLAKYISHSSLGIQVGKAKDRIEKEITLTVAAASEKSLNVTLKTERRTYHKRDITLPFALPFGETAAELEAYQSNLPDTISYLINKANTVECSMEDDILTTFNGMKFKNEMPHACFQVLSGDASGRFLVRLKRDSPKEPYQIMVQIANNEYKMYVENDEFKVRSSEGIVILPYMDKTNGIQITKKSQGIALIAGKSDLHEVFFDKNAFKIKVVEGMKGKTSGICGKADGEILQEYRKPNGQLTEDPVSYAHSWVVPAISCRDASAAEPPACFVERKSVKLEKQVYLHGQQSKCYSVDPVLRCLDGCTALRTTTVNVGFHCVPADSNISQGRSNFYGKSVDLIETAEAHLACRCSPQCA